MGKICSVVGCNSKEHCFTVRDKWKDLNPHGWKNHAKLFICIKHFNPSDICTGRVKFVSMFGKPNFPELNR